jgi:hypothetical protein
MGYCVSRWAAGFGKLGWRAKGVSHILRVMSVMGYKAADITICNLYTRNNVVYVPTESYLAFI